MDDSAPRPAAASPGEPSAPSPAVSSPPVASRSVRPGPRWKRLLLILAGCLLIGGGVQFVASVNDNSVQNGVTLAALGVAVVSLLIWTYRTLSQQCSRGIAVAVVLGLVLVPASLFRLRGFTGEIVPVIELRFSGPREFRDQQADTAEPPAHVASSDFPQFLGPDRDATLPQRQFAIPAADLQPLWRQPIGEGWAGIAIHADRCVTLEQRGDQEWVSCYRLGDGALVWAAAVDARHAGRVGGNGPRSTPTIDAGQVFTQGATGIVQCLDLASGEVLWRRDLLELAGWSQTESEAEISWGRAGSPLLVDRLCIVPLGGPEVESDAAGDAADAASSGRSLVALDRRDGSVRWTAGSDQISFASPMLMTLDGVAQIVSVNERTVTGHRIADGTELWRTRWRGSSNGQANCAAALAVGDNAFLVGKAYGSGSAVFEVTAGEEGWEVNTRWARTNVLKTKFTHAAVAGQYAYALSDGTLECVDLTDGKRAWAQPRGNRYGHGQLVLVDDVLVVQTEAGEIAFVAARPDRFEPLATLSGLSSKTWNIPAVAGRYLAIRNDTEVLVYQLPPHGQSPAAEQAPQAAASRSPEQRPAARSPTTRIPTTGAAAAASAASPHRDTQFNPAPPPPASSHGSVCPA